VTTTVPTEVPISEARAILTDIATAAIEHGAETTLTRHGKAVAKVVHPDAATTPHPDLWQAAQEAYDTLDACDLSADSRRILNVLGTLLGAYNGQAATCGRCGAALTASGSGWVDAEGWDKCQSTAFDHEPAATPTAEETP
jgi:antitoxin (DNA-binding transcriptional repressor) of toxin-antitoxin stability system